MSLELKKRRMYSMADEVLMEEHLEKISKLKNKVKNLKKKLKELDKTGESDSAYEPNSKQREDILEAIRNRPRPSDESDKDDKISTRRVRMDELKRSWTESENNLEVEKFEAHKAKTYKELAELKATIEKETADYVEIRKIANNALAKVEKLKLEITAMEDKCQESTKILSSHIFNLKREVRDRDITIKSHQDTIFELRDTPIDTLEYDKAQEETAKLRVKLFDMANMVEKLVTENDRLQLEHSLKDDEDFEKISHGEYLEREFPLGSSYIYDSLYYNIKKHHIRGSIEGTSGIDVVCYDENHCKLNKFLSIKQLSDILGNCRFENGRVGRVKQ